MFQFSQSLFELESVSELKDELPMSIQLPISNDNFRHPSSDEVRLVLEDAGLTQVRTAELLGVTDRTMMGWLSHGAERSTIPYATWRAVLFELKIVDVDESSCANWWLVNNSVMSDSMAMGLYAVQNKIGPYTSYRTANNIAAQKNAESFAKYLSDFLIANEIQIVDPDAYEYWELVREEWLVSNAAKYEVLQSL